MTIQFFAPSLCFLALLLAAGCEPSRAGPAFEKMAGYFPNFVLKTHEGKEARFYDDLVKGKIVLINFMMTTCRGT